MFPRHRIGRRHHRVESSDFHSTASHKPTGVPAKIVKADLRIWENSLAHHTDQYEICQEGYIDDLTSKSCPAQLVVRRGQTFKVVVHFDKKYDAAEDRIRVVTTLGELPLRSKGTRHEMVVGEADDSNWSIESLSTGDDKVQLTINTPPNCAIGKWSLSFDTVKVDKNGAVRCHGNEAINSNAYILFNAWCKDDAVFMDDPSWRDEYVLNDSGKIYTGNYRQIFGKPWNFGQFESVTLETALYLLNTKGSVPMRARGNPVVLGRKMSALVNSSDDYGVLTGRWDGKYADGVSPTKWTGSVAILQKYMETKRPVEYGQCWVFSGVMTTICRSLGIPTRSVTNFASAHDTDGSLTIDVHWNENDEPIPELDYDSVWNFHVWNESWMARPDLKAGYGGWQALDATPQETSDGVYCAGPASVVAIKNGDVGTPYDAPFVFAEVNADKVHWCKQKDGSIRRLLQRDVIGKRISTKNVGPSRNFSIWDLNQDRLDITDQYKYTEGTQMERAAVWRAAQTSTKPTIYGDEDAEQDVSFTVKDIDDLFLGDNINITIEVQNKSSERRSVSLAVTLSSVYYTGVTRTKLKQESYTQALAPNSSKMLKMNITAKDYLQDMQGHGYAMKINYLGTVKETKQLYASQDDFRLRTIIPDVTPSKTKVTVGESFKVKASFTNPLQKMLTGCVFSFEAAGNLKPTNIKASDVPVGGLVEAECDVTAKRKKDCVVIVAFDCKEMEDLQGQCMVAVGE